MSEEGLHNLRRSRNTRVLPCGELVPIIKGFRQRWDRERGPYRELLGIRLAKRYVNPHPDKKTLEQLKGDMLFDNIQREIAGAQMSCFKLSGAEYPLLPRSAFYDYLYVSALCQP